MKPIKDIFKEMYPHIFRYIPTEPKSKWQQRKTVKIPVKMLGLSTGKVVKVNVVK